MSDADRFIDEVSEELRRDKLFGFMRKYGWIAVALVLLLVGGTAWMEWQKARGQSAAEALGDEIMAALDNNDQAAREAALDAIDTSGNAAVLVTLLKAGDPGSDGALSAGEIEALQGLAANTEVTPVYSHLAALKLVMSGRLDADARLALLQPLLIPGAPYRVLAEEQMAFLELETGARDAALQRLQALIQDDNASRALRARATQLIVSLGEIPETAPANDTVPADTAGAGN